MGKKTPKAPPAPDPIATANAQGAANAEAARLNQRNSMVSQYTPYGSLVYNETSPDRWSATQTLSPEQQRMLDQDNALGIQMNDIAAAQLGRVSNALSSPADYSRMTQYAAPITGYRPADVIATTHRDTQQIADLMNQRESGRMNAQRDALRTQMLNQGIREGTDAWKRGMDDWNRQQNDFQIGAQLAAGQEQSRIFQDEFNESQKRYNQYNQHLQNVYQQQQDAANYQNALRQSQISEYDRLRNAPLNEIAALMGGSQVQNPNYINAPGYQQQASPVADSIYGSYQGQLQRYNQQMQDLAARRQGIASLIGTGAQAAMMFSDARLKTGIKRIGATHGGLPVYTFNYIWGGPLTVGVMAQEALKMFPGAVHRIGGYLAVDYGAIR